MDEHPSGSQTRHFDVLIVGAGLSGIAAAYYLQKRCPHKTYAILEAREGIGGTWDLFRYPGIRSDSDMFTLGYSFRPWTGDHAIADGPSILAYLRATAAEHGIDHRIRFGVRVEHASWSSQAARWTVAARTESGAGQLYSCSFLWACTGYYRYDRGYTPDLPGIDRFTGLVVHPQHWSDELEYEGQRVVVIGSGATAMTLVPELAAKAAQVTMLQRSPTYVLSRPREDRVATWLRERLPARSAYALTRWKNMLLGMAFYGFARRFPERTRRWLLGQVRAALGRDFDVDTHFTPSYRPWDQRLCLIADGDLFEAIREGRVRVVTDHIERFTERGISLRSGRELEADLVVTATGLELQFLGGAEVEVDGEPVVLAQTMMYKGAMLSEVPNAAISLGYTNASWTLKCELTCEYVCRLLNHMDARGYHECRPRRSASVDEEPPLGLTSGYITRALDRLPRQGSRAPWRVYQNYLLDRLVLRRWPLHDGTMEFSRVPASARVVGGAVAAARSAAKGA